MRGWSARGVHISNQYHQGMHRIRTPNHAKTWQNSTQTTYFSGVQSTKNIFNVHPEIAPNFILKNQKYSQFHGCFTLYRHTHVVFPYLPILRKKNNNKTTKTVTWIFQAKRLECQGLDVNLQLLGPGVCSSERHGCLEHHGLGTHKHNQRWSTQKQKKTKTLNQYLLIPENGKEKMKMFLICGYLEFDNLRRLRLWSGFIEHVDIQRTCCTSGLGGTRINAYMFFCFFRKKYVAYIFKNQRWVCIYIYICSSVDIHMTYIYDISWLWLLHLPSYNIHDFNLQRKVPQT